MDFAPDYSVAEHYANVACPIITYQPKMSDEVKKLRKF
ncbi:MAG: cyclic lactone autoinducer peptide [Lachnospira sp.]